MYYKEKIINGVLSFKTTPDGEWRPMSAKALTNRILQLQKEHEFQLQLIRGNWECK